MQKLMQDWYDMHKQYVTQYISSDPCNLAVSADCARMCYV